MPHPQCLTAQATAGEKITDPYDLARALLSERGPHDNGFARGAGAHSLLHFDEPMSASIWRALADEAEYHGIAPLLEPMIAALTSRLEVPDEVRRAFVALASRHRRAAVVREACIDQLLETFAAAGVAIILLKGAALAHRIYPNPSLRPMVDIDVLVDPRDTDRAIKLAAGLGYSFASRHGSHLSGRMHHLPVATTVRSGFRIPLEVHLDAMSPNQAESLTFAKLTTKPQPFRRGTGPDGLALGHADMLRHLAHHAFEPARRVRLIHLYDLWRYQTIFHEEIDWRTLEARFPETITILRLVSCVFRSRQAGDGLPGSGPVPAGVGLGMVPLSEIAASDAGFVAKLAAVFSPPAWWLHGFYGIPPEKSLVTCRVVRHPATVARWVLQRLIAGITMPAPICDDRQDARACR
jgi:Uncharacterised nucleotidyltransferase